MEIFSDLWSWLDTHSNPIGALSSIVFGLSSATIAILAYLLTRFNNYGVRPIVLQTRRMITYLGENERLSLTLNFEVWNRRKYPITIDFLKITFRNEVISEETTGWIVFPNGPSAMKDEWTRLEQGQFKAYVAELYLRAYDLDYFKDQYTIEVRYVDPMASKKKTLTLTDSFDSRNFPR